MKLTQKAILQKNLKVATHTIDRNIRNVTDNVNLQQKMLINRTLLITTTPIDPQIDDRVATSRSYTIKLAMPRTTEVITDAAHSNTQTLLTLGHVSRTRRDGSTPAIAKFL